MSPVSLEKKALQLLSASVGEQEAKSLVRILREDLWLPSKVSELDVPIEEAYADAVRRVLAGEPIQYVVQNAHFFGLNFYVDHHVLIPRPETELLVEMATKYLTNRKGNLRVLDIGTGSGCIAITLASQVNNIQVVAIDKSSSALEVASKNSQRHGMDIEMHKVDFLQTETWPDLGHFDLICSNPPYIASTEYALMSKSTLEYEPEMALFPEGSDHLIFYRKIAEFCLDHLRAGGALILEMNEYHGLETEALFTAKSYEEVSIHQDLSGKSRILTASRPRS